MERNIRRSHGADPPGSQCRDNRAGVSGRSRRSEQRSEYGENQTLPQKDPPHGRRRQSHGTQQPYFPNTLFHAEFEKQGRKQEC